MSLFNLFIRKKPGKTFESDFTNDAMIGDVVLYRGDVRNILATGIELFTSSPYSHAAIYGGNGWTIGADAFGTTYEKYPQKKAYDLFRYESDKETHENILRSAQNKIGRPYSYEQGFLFPFLSKERIKQLSLDKIHNCSEMVAITYKDCSINLINIKIGKEAIIAPADIGRSLKLKYIGTYNKGKLFSRNENEMRNIFIEQLQGKRTSLIGRIITFFFKKWSTKDDFYKNMFDNNIYLEKKND